MRSFAILTVAVAALIANVVPASAATRAQLEQQRLVIGVGWTPLGILDPAAADYQDTVSIQSAFLAPLYRSVSGKALDPVLAAGAPAVSADGRVITVTLRAAKWSDGRAISAVDVVTAFNRARKSKNYYSSLASSVSKVSAPGARKVVISLAKPDPTVVPLLASTIFTPVPTHSIKKYKAAWTKAGKMAASGPFVLSASSARVTEGIRNRFYFRKAGVKLQRIQFVATGSSATTFTKLKSGTIDTVLPRTLASAQLAAAAKAKFLTMSTASFEGQYLYLNTKSPRLLNAEVRRALALALDRRSIATTDAWASSATTSTFVPTTIPGQIAPAGPSLLGAQGAPDPAGAAARLTAAGWNPGTVLNLYFSVDTISGTKMAARIRENLAAVGVSVQLKPTKSANLAKVGIGVSPVRDDVDMVLQGWVADFVEPVNFFQILRCSSIASGLNTSNYCDPTYDATLDSIAAVYDPAQRAAAFAKLEDQVTGATGTFPIVPLFVPSETIAVRPTVKGMAITPGGLTDWGKVSKAKR